MPSEIEKPPAEDEYFIVELHVRKSGNTKNELSRKWLVGQVRHHVGKFLGDELLDVVWVEDDPIQEPLIVRA